jgi:photosystem II stability/assembly factor-like uncharacterized protein
MLRNRRFPGLIVLFASAALVGCGGSGGSSSAGNPLPTPTPAAVAVSVSPASANVQVAHTLQFTATVTGTTNQGVAWKVNGTAGGNATLGTISASGLYTAPNSLPNPNTVTVAAMSTADASKSASAGIQIVPPPSPVGTWSREVPFGGIVSNLTIDPRAKNTIYATAFNSGVFKSTDGGQTWTALFSPTQSNLTTSEPASIAVGSAASTLYFVVGVPPNTMTLFTSFDAGNTISSRKLPAGLPGFRITIDPRSDSILYVWGHSGISKSLDGGVSWTTFASAPQNVNILRIDAQNPDLVYAGTVSGLYKSPDAGGSWLLSNTGIDPNFVNIADIAQDQTNPARIVVGANTIPGLIPAGRMYASSDGGANWTETTAVGNGWPFATVTNIQMIGSTVYAAVFNTPTVLKSTDGGFSWSSAATGIPDVASSLLLQSTAPDTLLFSSTAPFSVRRSVDGGTSWGPSTAGIYGFTGEQVRLDPSSNSTMYFAAANGGGVWKSTDQGASWANLLDANIFAVAVDPKNPLHLLASDLQQFLLESTDGGTTWHQVPTPIAIVESIEFSPTQPGIVLACSPNGGIARSSDSGTTWKLANTGLQTTACRKIGFDPVTPSTVFAATPSGVYKSNDAGATWTNTKAVADVQKTGYFRVLVDPVTPTVVYTVDPDTYYKSTDGGSTWAVLNSGISPDTQSALAIDPLAHNTLYVSSFGSSVAVSSDAGQTWATMNSGLGFAQVQDLLVIPGTSHIFAATFNNGLLAFR